MIGFSARAVDAMTFAEFAACAEGFRDFNTPADAPRKMRLDAPNDMEVAAYRAAMN